MAQIKVTETKLQGIRIIEPQMFGDNRGWFMRVFPILIYFW